MAEGEVLANLILQGEQEFQRGVEESADSVSDLGSQAETASGGMGGFSGKLDSARDSLQKFGSKARDIGGTLSLGVTAPLLGVGAASIKAASDVEEMQSKFDAVFKDQADAAEAWADQQAEATNRSQYELMGYMASLQDTFVPMGVAREEAAQMSQEVTTLAQDLASFNNMPTEEALNAIQSGLVGNHENFRQFGVVINQTNLGEQLQEQFGKPIEEATEQEKMLARLQILYEGTSDAQGDATETADSFANQMRGLKASLRDVGVEIGQQLIPIAQDLINFIQPLIERFSGLDERMQRLIIIGGGMAAALGPLLFIIGSLATVVAGLSLPIIGAVGAVAALIAIAISFREELAPLISQLQPLVQAFQAKIPEAVAAGETALARLQTFIQPLIEDIRPLIVALGTELVETLQHLRSVSEDVLGRIQSFWDSHGTAILSVVLPLATALREVFEGILDFIVTVVRFGLALIRGDFKEAFKLIKEYLGRQVERFKSIGSSIIEALTNGIDEVMEKPVEKVEEMAGNIRDKLPFSDAKEGPLADLSLSGEKLPETFAAGMEGNLTPVSSASDKLASSAYPSAGAAGAGTTGGAGRASGGGQTVIEANIEEGAVRMEGITWQEALSRVDNVMDRRLNQVIQSIQRKNLKG